MKRIEVFHSFKNHAMLQKDYNKLTQNEREECVRFINENAHLDQNEFTILVNRWKLDRPQERSKNFTRQWALLTECNVLGK